MDIPLKLKPLFIAYSKVASRAFLSKRLISCNILSKYPGFANVGERFLANNSYTSLTYSGILKQVLKYLVSNFGHLLFIVYCKFIVVFIGWKHPFKNFVIDKKSNENFNNAISCGNFFEVSNFNRSLLILDTFALFDNIAVSGEYKEHCLPNVKKTALELGADVKVLYRHYGSRSPIKAFKVIKILKEQNDGLLDIHLISWLDCFALFWHIISYPFCFIGLIKSLEREVAATPCNENNALSQESEDIVRAKKFILGALKETFGQCILTGELRRVAGKNLGNILANLEDKKYLSSILSWYENQTVNKAFIKGLRSSWLTKKCTTPIIGAQLLLWPDNLLNNHADDLEISLKICPDMVMVTGEYFLPNSSKQKYMVAPALRYNQLFENIDKKSKSSTSEECSLEEDILVIYSYHDAESLNLSAMAKSLTELGYKVRCKPHPATNPLNYNSLIPKGAKLELRPLKEALASSFLAIGLGTGALPEAICLGVPVLTTLPKGKHFYLNYLPNYGQGKLWDVVIDPKNLKELLEKLNSFKSSKEYAETLDKFKNMLVTNPDQESIKDMILKVLSVE